MPPKAKQSRPSSAAPDLVAAAPADLPAPPTLAPPATPPTPPATDTGVTPSMARFLEIKAANPDCILWYRMGDFYELFFEDAVVASAALGIVLTKRGRHLGLDIPMCGVPVHRADEYLQRLIRKGFRVAVCEQLEDPAEAKKRGAKAVVRRDVVRLVTPGTLTEDTLLDARTRNFLTALFQAPKSGAATPALVALASLDISTGEFEVGEVAAGDLAGELMRLAPGEVIAVDAALADGDLRRWIEAAGAAATPVPGATFDSASGERQLKAALAVLDTDAFGAFSRAELAAVGALLRYVDLTQLRQKPIVRPPRRTGPSAVLVIDAATRASLELLRSTSGERRGSLLGAIDRTITGAGARTLADRLSGPLRNLDVISGRLDALAFLLQAERLREDIRQHLKSAPDLARAIARLAFQRGSPRDLGAVRDALGAGRACTALLARAGAATGLPADIGLIAERLAAVDGALQDQLAAALVETPPHQKRDGGFVRPGFRADLDEARQLREDSRQVMAALEARYVDQSGVKSLKVRHNNILGYFLEVTAGNARPLLSPPLDATFRHRQTMANAVRFTTVELVDIEGRIATAADRALAIEQEIFAEFADAIARAAAPLGAFAAGLADLDCTAALAELAFEQGYVRPSLDTSAAFDIRDGRHPVVEQALRAAKAAPFIANDCVLGLATDDSAASLPPGFDETTPARIWLVTGPNMAGKSTFLRQNALITVLAQMGSFVPARSAHIGLVDRLFSRVGASDDLARGRSTFMVEMVETAGILTQATAASLVILDEIGRGTATFDGLSIAWAAVEYLHAHNKCRALFATHYHELTALAAKLGDVANVTMDVKEWRDEIVFLHRVRPGAADRSYGIQVAKLAGMPAAVVRRAGEVLRLLEASQAKSGTAQSLVDDLPLFAAARPKGHTIADAEPSPVETALAALSIDELSPRAALDALYRLKDLATKTKP